MKLLSDKKNIIFGLSFSYISVFISLIASFFITPVILNNVGDRSYGLFSFCNSITSWLSIISTSLGASYLFFANKDKKENGDVSRTNTVFSNILFILSGAVALFSLIILRFINVSGFSFEGYTADENSLIYILLIISSLNIAVTIFFSAFTLYNNLNKSFAFIRGVQILVSLLTYGLNVVLAIYTKSIISIAIISLSNSLLNGLFNFFYATKIKKMPFYKKQMSKKEKGLSYIFKYSSIILISTIIANLDSNLDKTLLGIMINPESVTMYQLSITFATHLLVLSFSFTEVMRPRIYELYRFEKKDEANKLFLIICKVQSIVTLFIIGGYIACGYHFVTLWVGGSRINVFFYSTALFLSNIVPLTKSADGEARRANNILRTPTIINIASITFNVAISVTLLIVLNKEYAVWACIIGTIVPRVIFSWIIMPIYNHKKINLPMGKYYIETLKNIIYMFVAISPSILITIFINDVEIHLVFKVLLEGFSFVFVYLLELLVFEKKKIKSSIKAFLGNKEERV